MAAPTPPSASKRATGSVSTPSHLNHSSPAPRSVPSPVAARHPAGKTPVNHPTTGSSGSKTLGSTPMVQTLSQTGYTSSPSANMLSFGTPSGLGIEGTTPAGLNIPTPALGGANMVPTMSDLGLTASGGKRNEDEERRAKMRKVLKRIGKPKGRVSEEGIARVSRRVGFANDIDAEKLTPEERERKVGNRPISTAGNAIVIDIHLKDQVPQSVQVIYSVQSKALDEQGEKAGKVLLDNLRAPDGIALHATLDRFGANLERLARMDRLSSDGVNCFEVLSGVYASLRRLYEKEKQVAEHFFKADGSDAEGRADVEVMCKKSGKPLVHGLGRLGLEIVYWRDSRHVGRSTKPSAVEMEVDGQENKKEASAATQDDDSIFTLHIEAEPSPAGLYPSLRVSEAWLPDPLELPAADSAEGMPWQDPPVTVLPVDTSGDAMAVDGQQKLPDLRFIAKLDPPLVMEYHTAMNVLTRVGVPTPPMFAYPPRYADMLLNPLTATPAPPENTAAYTTTALQRVLSHKDGQETTIQHGYALNCLKLEHGFRIEELPFSHPRQLIEVLPTLRQWASVGALLGQAFTSSLPTTEDHLALNGNASTNGTLNVHSAMDQPLMLAANGQLSDKRPVNITLTASPVPTLGVAFSAGQDDNAVKISVQILPNADLSVTSHEGVLSSDSSGTSAEAQMLAHALDVCGDLGVWVEWIRSRS